MTISVIATSAANKGANGATTVGIDTTGADFIVIGISYYGTNSLTVSDNKSNSWTPRTAYQYNSSESGSRLYYCLAPTVGSGHTFTISGTGIYATISAIAFSGVAGYLNENGNTGNDAGGAIVQPSIDPSVDNALIVTTATKGGTPDITAIDSGFTLAAHSQGTSAQSVAYGLAYLIQGAHSSVSPTFTVDAVTAGWGVAGASFSAAAASGNLFRRPLMNGLGAGGPFFNNPLGRSMLGWAPSFILPRRALLLPRKTKLVMA